MGSLVACIDESLVEVGGGREYRVVGEGYAVLYLDAVCFYRALPANYYLVGSAFRLLARRGLKNYVDVVDRGFHVRVYPGSRIDFVFHAYLDALRLSKLDRCVVLALIGSSLYNVLRRVEEHSAALKGYDRVLLVLDAKHRQLLSEFRLVHLRLGFSRVREVIRGCIVHSMCDVLARYAAMRSLLYNARLRATLEVVPRTLMDRLSWARRLVNEFGERLRSVFGDRFVEE